MPKKFIIRQLNEIMLPINALEREWKHEKKGVIRAQVYGVIFVVKVSVNSGVEEALPPENSPFGLNLT